MKKYKHSGIEVLYQITDKHFKDFLKINGIEYIDLPILEDVIQYSKEGIIKYAYIVPCGIEEYYEKIYITKQIPLDMSWEKLANDIDSQVQGASPMQIESKAHFLCKTVEDLIMRTKSKPYSLYRKIEDNGLYKNNRAVSFEDIFKEEDINPIDFRLTLGNLGYTVDDLLAMDTSDVNIEFLLKMKT